MGGYLWGTYVVMEESSTPVWLIIYELSGKFGTFSGFC